MKKKLLAILGIAASLTLFAACDDLTESSSSSSSSSAHEHTWEGDWSKDATNHWHACEGDDCSEKNGLAAHVFDKQVATDAYLKTAATCMDEAVYYKSCVCGQAGTETFESGSTVAHDFANGTLIQVGATQHELQCANCTETQTATDCSATSDNDCTTDDVCACGRIMVEGNDDHNIGGVYEKDESQHWQACQNGDCIATGTKAAHDVEGKSFETSETNHWKTCDCGYKVGDEAHERVDETLHYNADKTEQYYLCECGAHLETTAHTHNYTFASESGYDVGNCVCGTDEVRVQTAFEGASANLLVGESATLSLPTDFAGTVTKVMLGETEIVIVGTPTEESVALNTAALAAENCGNQTLTVTFTSAYGGTHTTTLNVAIANQFISTVAELKAFGAACYAAAQSGYYMLTADLDCKDEANMAVGNPGWQKNGLRGVFDGNGKTISNIKMIWDSATGGYGGLFGNLAGATVKNVTFNGVNYASVNTALFGRHSIEGNGKNTIIENVTVNISAWAATGEAGVFVSRETRNTIYNNCVINVPNGVTVHNLLGQEWNSNHTTATTGITVNIQGEGAVTAYYWTTTSDTTAAATAPTVITVNQIVFENVEEFFAAENGTAVTLTSDKLTEGTVKVTINNITQDAEVANAGELAIDLADFGVTTLGKQFIVVESGLNQISFDNVWYVTQVIDDATELKALGAACKAANTTGYYILGGDIDCSAEANMAVGNPGWQANGFSGTFDGRGYTISNVKMIYDSATSGYGGLFGNLAGCTIKNVVFDKVNYASANVALFGRHSYASGGNNVTLENLTVNVSNWAATGEAGLFVSRGTINTIYNGCTVNIADGVTVHNLLGQEWQSPYGSGITVNLGTGSAITSYYWTGTVDTTAVTTAPSNVTVKNKE